MTKKSLMRPPVLLTVLTIALAALLAICAQSSSRPTQADITTASMSFNVQSPLGLCDDPDKPTKCTMPAGITFTLSVAINGLPDENYIGIQSQVFYGELVYKPAATGDEIVWPDSALRVRRPATPTGLEGIVSHGALSGITSFPESDHTGNIVQIALNCSEDTQSFKLALPSYNRVTNAFGAGFKLADMSAVPPKTVGQQDIDIDGDTTPETVDVAATLDINCALTATPTDTAAPATGEISVRTIAVVPDGASRREQACKADAIVVVARGRIVGFKAKNPSFSLGVGDRVPVLAGRTGASFLSVDDRGRVQRGLRDCVEVTR